MTMQSQSKSNIAPTKRTASLVETLNRSTIYDSHEARRMHTIQLKDDPRSAPIRVLSCLPGFRLFIHPYKPNESHVVINQHHRANGLRHQEQQQKCDQNREWKQDAFPPLADTATVFTMMKGTTSDNNNKSLASNMSNSRMILASGGLCVTAMSILRLQRMNHIAAAPSAGAVYAINAVPLFAPSNSAAVVFLRPSTVRVSHRPMFSFYNVMNLPAARNMVALSFLGFVVYKNMEYQKQTKP